MRASKLRNSFSLSEWSGAVGDLGITLPIAYALILFNGFSPERIFFLWGLTYVLTGWYFKVPVSVQPLKAMAVIAFTTGFTVGQLSTTAVFYGILLLILSLTGIIGYLEKIFSKALIRGIQLGIGLILLHKAFDLIVNSGLFFGVRQHEPAVNISITIALIIIMAFFQFKLKKPISIFIIILSIIISILAGATNMHASLTGTAVDFALPQWDFLISAIIVLMIPQLPLTLGNAVYAANDSSHLYWKEQSVKVTPKKLGVSIGLNNILIGLMGGFPICHGAGGMAAHAKFGGRTGGTTMIIGGILIVFAIISPLSHLLFYIPIPVLGTLLIFASWGLISLIVRLKQKHEIATAIIVGLISYFSRNLAYALAAGFILEYIIKFVISKRTHPLTTEN